MKARYVRISTPDQKFKRQLIKQHHNEKLFIDVCSGTIPFKEREQGMLLFETVNTGDIDYLSVDAVDRLGRNILDILTTLQHFEEANVNVKIDNLGIESLVSGRPNAAFKMIVSVLSNVAEMERNTMLERQRQGIAIAKAKGVYQGRLKGTKDSSDTILIRYKNVVKHLKEGYSLRKTAKLCDVSLGTVQKVKALM